MTTNMRHRKALKHGKNTANPRGNDDFQPAFLADFAINQCSDSWQVLQAIALPVTFRARPRNACLSSTNANAHPCEPMPLSKPAVGELELDGVMLKKS